MTEPPRFAKSRPVIVVPYRDAWRTEYHALARRIRSAVGESVLRIDHIGSTAVPGLAAKDVVDVQITVLDLATVDALFAPLISQGFRLRPLADGWHDLFFGMPEDDLELRKRYAREPNGEKRTHIHIREQGCFNQRYALLFRDYLRASPDVRYAYEQMKVRAAALFPDSIDGYLYLKDPFFHVVFAAASLWASQTRWVPLDDYQ